MNVLEFLGTVKTIMFVDAILIFLIKYCVCFILLRRIRA